VGVLGCEVAGEVLAIVEGSIGCQGVAIPWLCDLGTYGRIAARFRILSFFQLSKRRNCCRE
jgi:hypothetical protein